MIEQGPAQCPPLHHIEPVEVPDEAHRGSVKPFPTGGFHEVSLGAPDEEEQNQPRAQEVGEDEAGQYRGEEGQSYQARQEEQQVPDVVDQRRDDVLLLLVRQEGAQGAMVHSHAAGNG